MRHRMTLMRAGRKRSLASMGSTRSTEAPSPAPCYGFVPARSRTVNYVRVQDTAGAPSSLSSASTKKYSPHITLSSTPRSSRSW